MPFNRRAFVKRRQPTIPAYRERRPQAAACELYDVAARAPLACEKRKTERATADRLATIKDDAQALRGRDDLLERAIEANRKTREAQRDLYQLEPLHRASTGAQRTVLDRRIKRALARMNAALREFVLAEEAMSPEIRAKLHAMIDKLPSA